MHASKVRKLGVLCTAIAAGLLTAAGGCAKHGKYVGEGLEERQAMHASMKAANEYEMARQNFVAGDLEKATAHIDNCLALNDSLAKSWLLKGRIEAESNRFEGALEAFSKATELDPSMPEPFYYAGVVHERLLDQESALVSFQKAFELAPTEGQYAVATAEVLIDLGQLDEAESFLRGLSSSLEHNPGVKQTLGHIAMIKGETEAAVDLFSEAQLLAPDDQAITEDLATAQVEAGRYAEAEFNLSRILEDPENANRRDLQHLRARCLMELDRPVEAREVLLGLTSDAAGASDTSAWIELGHVSYVLKDMNRVKLCASRVIGQSPERYEGYMLRAMWQRHEGDLNSALQSLETACVWRGEETAPLMLRGIVAQEAGNLELARECFAQASQADPENVTASRLLAVVESRIQATSVATVPENNDK